ncbi:PREDICTED: nuclear transcription factor Y subunit B-5 [Tarenaya hassleriana]|uniref:nuclear transcription factor Y subunit B-5 n=1 Tax=Tarenaya hassleriana TaxID=28532 RepID=UPI00053C25F4|nr:PREDICTED: nuclear transcription factor Y subunit B-5 [Tarenaya hassleriana]
MAGNPYFQDSFHIYHDFNFGGSSSNSNSKNKISPPPPQAINIVEEEEEENVIKEQDMLLPIANVGRIMKNILPPNAKISKEAKETMQECVSEFISFVTGEASDKCHKEKRKTVNGDDICWALGNLGFDNYADQLKKYLNRFRMIEGERAHSAKGATHHPTNR